MKIAVVGLGYVGLPLSLQFARSGVQVVGLDIDSEKVEALNQGRSSGCRSHTILQDVRDLSPRVICGLELSATSRCGPLSAARPTRCASSSPTPNPWLQLVVCAPVRLLAGPILIWVLTPMRRVALGLVDILKELKSRRVSSNTS